MYRVLTYVWLIVGVGLIIHDSYAPNAAWTIPGVGWSAGWLCFALAAYNFMRWWSRRMEVGNRAQRRSYLRHPPPVRREMPDPNFIFTDDPPPAEPPTESRE